MPIACIWREDPLILQAKSKYHFFLSLYWGIQTFININNSKLKKLRMNPNTIANYNNLDGSKIAPNLEYMDTLNAKM